MLCRDICLTILCMYYDQCMSVGEIAACVMTEKHDVSERTVERVVQRFEDTGEVSPPASASAGRDRAARRTRGRL